MLIHPWDAATDDSEWQEWLGQTERFGVLAVNNADSALAPLVVPTHFTLGAGELLLHLARPNPVWSHIEAAEEVRLVVMGDYAFIPGYWRAADDVSPHDGVPTSYYTSVQFVCRPAIIDDPEGKADVLTRQLGDLQPEGQHREVSDEAGPYSRMLPGIRALRLTILRVEAKFKYDDHKSRELRERVSGNLDDRDHGLDQGASGQQRRRTASATRWRPDPTP